MHWQPEVGDEVRVLRMGGQVGRVVQAATRKTSKYIVEVWLICLLSLHARGTAPSVPLSSAHHSSVTLRPCEE